MSWNKVSYRSCTSNYYWYQPNGDGWDFVQPGTKTTWDPLLIELLIRSLPELS
jgi:hypothetical protein